MAISLSSTFAVTAVADEPVSASEPRETVRVAGIVLKWVRGDKEANMDRIEPLIREATANGAEIVCTTESFLDGYAIADKSIPLNDYRALAEPIPLGSYVQRLAVLADDLDIHLVAGVHELYEGKHYNAAILIGPGGELVGKYHKQRLGHEIDRNTPGSESAVFDTPYGRMGIMICSDRNSATLVKRFRDNGADFLFCPSGGAFGPIRNDPKVQARSRENGIPIVFVHPVEFLVTGPDGSILERTILGDVPEGKPPPDHFLTSKEQIGSVLDRSGIYYFDLPLPEEIN
jgi:predicted amidohydrolase